VGSGDRVSRLLRDRNQSRFLERSHDAVAMSPEAWMIHVDALQTLEDVELVFGDDDPSQGSVKVAATDGLAHLAHGAVDEVWAAAPRMAFRSGAHPRGLSWGLSSSCLRWRMRR